LDSVSKQEKQQLKHLVLIILNVCRCGLLSNEKVYNSKNSSLFDWMLILGL